MRRFSDRYQLFDRLDGSDEIEIYKALDRSFPRNVFVTVFSNCNNPTMLFFRSRIQSLAKLSHHNIMSIFNMECEEDVCYLISEYRDGVTLQEAIEQNHRFSLEEGLHIAFNLTDALAHAHEMNISHGNLNSEMIWLRGSNIKLSFLYALAPQISSKTVSGNQQTDLVQLGKVLKELFSATPPLYRPDIQNKVQELIERLSGKHQPGYQTASDAAHDLKMILTKDLNRLQRDELEYSDVSAQSFHLLQAERQLLFTVPKTNRLQTTIGKIRSSFMLYFLLTVGMLVTGAALSVFTGTDQTPQNLKPAEEAIAVSVAMAETTQSSNRISISPKEPMETLKTSTLDELGTEDIPNLIGKRQQDAEKLLLLHDYHYTFYLERSDAPKGTVFKQTTEVDPLNGGKPRIVFYVSSK